MGRITTKFIFVTTRQPSPLWTQLGPGQLNGTTGYEATSRSEIRGFIEGLRTMHRLTKTPMWFTCGLPNQAGIDHGCWISVDDDQAEFVWMDMWDDD